MKILVFEYITGGGFAQEELPKSLFNEGMLMLKALLSELDSLPAIQLTVLLDWRCKDVEFFDKIEIVWVSSEKNVYELLPELIDTADLVWPVAPEIGLELQKISWLVESKAKGLLNSSSQAVASCSDKLLTAQELRKNTAAVVETTRLDVFSQEIAGEWVIKPKDGAGCINSYFVTCQVEFDEINAQISNREAYIIQPYINGESLSLSCLFKDGKAWLLCCNRQQVLIKQGKFELHGCEVNIPTKHLAIYQQLIDAVAKSILGLWGYVGIDIIQPEFGNPLILEINPRLTTSYAGINQALGFNVAEAVINMRDNQPIIQFKHDSQYNINLQ